MSLPYLVVDLETHPRDDAESLMRPVTAPSNYKDPDAIARYIEERTAERREKLALDVDLARIACLGWLGSAGDVPDPGGPVRPCRTAQAERLAQIALFDDWDALNRYGDACVVTFNGLRFDMPLISRRAEALNVTMPESWPPIERYRSPKLVDLYDVLTFKGLVAGKDLATYCAIRGIIVNDPLPDGGAEVGQAITDGRWDDVMAHCAADVTRTKLLAERVLSWARQPETVNAG